jgi:hypothetical protein
MEHGRALEGWVRITKMSSPGGGDTCEPVMDFTLAPYETFQLSLAFLNASPCETKDEMIGLRFK